MTQDPYSILGVSPNATNDEIKKAYRDLSRKYHPDSHSNNPLSDLAEEKFKEVQEAYDFIMKQRESGSFKNSSSYTYTANSQDDPQISAVYTYINSRNYREALNILTRISNRNGRWYYLSSIANAGMGNNIVARDHAAQAVNLEPNNIEYRNLLNQFEFNNQRYQTGGYRNGSPMSTGNFCCDLWIADTCCECMGGDLCTCM